MEFSSLEIIALIVIIVGVIKVLFILANPQGWMNFAKKIWSKPALMTIISLILAIIILYYLLQELTIVQILATMAFIALLMAISLAPYVEALIKKYELQIKRKKILRENWLYLLIWIILMVWGLKEIFF